jgi:hypothetical protein
MYTKGAKMVAAIRSKYASGLYTKADIFLGCLGQVTKEELIGILDYSLFPEVRADLKDTILKMEKIQEVIGEYHKKNTILAEIDEQYTIGAMQPLMMQEEIQQNRKVALAKLKKLGITTELVLSKYAYLLEVDLKEYTERIRAKAIKATQKGSAYAAL